MRKLGIWCGLLVLALAGYLRAAEVPAQLYQVSTLQALMEGYYDGVVTAGELKKHGDYGIGTFQGLDGELVMLGGEVWQVKVSGEVVQVDDATGIPFANIARSGGIAAVKGAELAPFGSLTEIQVQVQKFIDKANLPHLVIITGKFGSVRTRSVPAQSRPYPRLVEVVKEQKEFQAVDSEGVMLGFWFPGYFTGINATGFHLHYISNDRKFGGHVLDCASPADPEQAKLTVRVLPLTEFRMILSASEDFSAADISQDKTDEIKVIEGVNQ